MNFRPCIDIHNGQVKQIVGGSLLDEGSRARENFVSVQNAAFFAALYREKNLPGGHVILLNPEGSEYYGATKAQALEALLAYPGGLQAGGGIRDDNAAVFLEAGASHVIVTSFVFRGGEIDFFNLRKLQNAVGKNRLVLDLSCRKKDEQYYIVTDRWQKYTEITVTEELLHKLTAECGEFLIHGVDCEGKVSGIESPLVEILASVAGFPMTYAGGVGSFSDIEELKEKGKNHIDVTVGSALDLFGGNMDFDAVMRACKGGSSLV